MHMRLTETATRFTLDDSARPLRGLGAAFVLSGAFVLSLPFHMGDWVTMPAWQKLGVIVLGLSHLAGGAFTMMQPAASRLDLDQATGDGTLRWRRPWGGERMQHGPDAETRFRLADVTAVDVVRTLDDGDVGFALVIALRDGRTLPVQANPVADARHVVAHAERMREFLGMGAERRAAA
jgi:hypothetical protein